MSKNTNLSFLTDYITADITNGRIGINNASPAYSFDVTGIARTSTSTYLATASGNVGIGTTSITADYDKSLLLYGVNPSFIIQTNDNTGYAYIHIKTPSYDWSLGYDAANNFKISNGANPATATKFTIASTGAATFASSVASTWHSVNGAIPSSVASTGYLDYSGGGTRLFSVGTSGATKGTFTFIAKGADDSSITPLSISNIGITTIMTNDNVVLKATNVAQAMYIDYRNSAGTRRSYMGFGGDSNSNFDIWNSENGAMVFGTNNSERMRILSGGNVQIGGTTAGNFALYVKGVSSTNANYALVVNNSTPGDLFFCRNDGLINTGMQSASPYNNADTGRSVIVNSGGTLGYTSSTRESKTNIKQLSDVSWLYQLNPVSFNYRKKDNEMNYTEEFHEEKWYGLIADEVESVNEDLIFYNTKEDNVKQLAGVEYSKIVPALVKAIQELSAEITILKNK
jgi:hypothetical protein